MNEFIGHQMKYELTNNQIILGILKEIKEETNTFIVEEMQTNNILRIPVVNVKNITLFEEEAESSQQNSVSSVENRNKSDQIFVEQGAMYRILEESFAKYFPSEEQFHSIVSHNVFKIIFSIFKTSDSDKMALIIGGDDFFARLGITLAMFLSNFSFKPDVYFCDEINDPLTVSFIQRFKNVGLNISERLSYKYKTVIVSSRGSFLSRNILKEISSEGFIYMDLPDKKINLNPNTMGIIYGVKDERIEKFGGRVVCVDVGIPNNVLNKYGVKRNYPNPQFYVKNNI